MDEELLKFFTKSSPRSPFLMKHALSLIDIVFGKEPAGHRKLHSMVADILESQKPSQLVSQRGVLEVEQTVHSFRNLVMGPAKIAVRQQREAHVRRYQIDRSNRIPPGRGKAKDGDQGVLLPEEMLQTLQLAKSRSRAGVHLEKMTDLPFVNNRNGSFRDDNETRH